MIKYLINSMFDELKEEKHFKETKSFESASRSRDLFRMQASICDGAFLWI